MYTRSHGKMEREEGGAECCWVATPQHMKQPCITAEGFQEDPGTGYWIPASFQPSAVILRCGLHMRARPLGVQTARTLQAEGKSRSEIWHPEIKMARHFSPGALGFGGFGTETRWLQFGTSILQEPNIFPN